MQLNYIVEIFSVSAWGSGVDIILDPVGGSYWEKNINCLSTDGRWIIYGLLGGGEVHGDLLSSLLSKRATIHTSLLRSRDKKASNGCQQCVQFYLKINEFWELSFDTNVKAESNTLLPKKQHLELLLYTLENTAKLSCKFPFLSNASLLKLLNQRNDTQDLLKYFTSTIVQRFGLRIKKPSSDQETSSSWGWVGRKPLSDHFSK